MMRRTGPTEKRWRHLEPRPPPNPHRGHAYVEHRRVINGILWRFRTGARWGDIPQRYGPWQTCYDRFVRWSRNGTWHHLPKVMQKAADEAGLVDWDGAALDATHVKAHRSASGANYDSQSIRGFVGIDLSHQSAQDATTLLGVQDGQEETAGGRPGKLEQGKASVRPKVEHRDHAVKCLFKHRKTRYRGLAKNNAELFTLFGSANLVLARRFLGIVFGQVAPGGRKFGLKFRPKRLIRETRALDSIKNRSARSSASDQTQFRARK